MDNNNSDNDFKTLLQQKHGILHAHGYNKFVRELSNNLGALLLMLESVCSRVAVS